MILRNIFEHGGELEKVEKLGISSESLLDFSVNINPFAPPEKLLQILKENLSEITRYPEPYSEKLTLKVTEKISLSPKCVIFGNGSNQLIYVLHRTLKPENVLLIQPTFSEYEKSATTYGTNIIDFLLSPDDEFNIPVDKLTETLKSADMVFICNPNNPTGNIFDREVLLYLLQKFPNTTFVVDEAFADFSTVKISLIDKVPEFQNLVILKSLTKNYSIPGIRLGYAVSNQKNISKLREQIEPWSVNRIAQVAGEILLEYDDFMEESRRRINRERERVISEITNINRLSAFSSYTNFLLIQSNYVSSNTIQSRLLEKKILVRDCSNFKGLDDHFFRIAIRKREDNSMLINALKEVKR